MGMAPSWLWISFVTAVVILLFADLFIFHKEAHQVKTSEALKVSAFWIALALAFNFWFGHQFGLKAGSEFLSGYVIEKSLSVDNLFVILLIFQALRIPPRLQHRVLFWGVFGAIVIRGTIIIFGAHLIERFHWILYIFGFILIVTAVKLLKDDQEEVEVAEHWAVKLLKKFYPVTHDLHDQKFFIKKDGATYATPLMVALILVEITDVVFAVDSIPAVFAVTTDAFIAFASNILALLGLRALFFVIADWVGKLKYLKPGLSVILGFVGVKMLIAKWFKIESWVSLLVIISVLITAALGSWMATARNKKNSL